jgi:hypothetical protein
LQIIGFHGVGMSIVEFEDCMGLVEVSDTWIIVEQ